MMEQFFSKMITFGSVRRILSVAFLVLLSSAANNAQAQTGYIQLKTRAISEENVPDFTYNISGGPTSVSAKTLSDRPDAFRRIYHIAGESAGGLLAIATPGTSAASPNPGTVYYRPSEQSEWQSTGFAAYRIDGAANGGFIAVVRTAASPAGAGSQVWYRENDAATPVNITGALTGKSITQVSHNYSDRIYAVTTETGSNLYSRPADLSSDWLASSNPQNVLKIDAVPNTDEIFHSRIQGSTIRLYKGLYNTNGTLWDNDLGGTGTENREGHDFAATQNSSGTAHVVYRMPDYPGVYYKKSSATNWVQDMSVSEMQLLTATGANGQMVYGALTLDQASLPNRIFARIGMGEFNGFWIDDERVQTAVKGNTVIIPVLAGTYTITQNPVAGWHTTQIMTWDPSNNSSANVTGSIATANVAAGELVTIEFEHQGTAVYDMSTALSCIPAFREDFSSYVNGTYGNPLTGYTSYHKANAYFGFGYYAVMTNLNALNTYVYPMPDHTNDAQRGMFVIDGSFEKGTFFRKQFTGVQPGIPYNFTAFIANINNQGNDLTKPNASFEIYNSATGALLAAVNSGDISADTTWHGIGVAFTSPVSDIDLVIRNNALGTVGNDLAIDDISFSLSIPAPEAKTVYSCADAGTVTVTAPVTASGSPIHYEYSIDGGSWQTNTVFTEVAAGTHTLYVRYETAAGCVSQADLTVVNNCIATPVKLLSFNAEPINNQVKLEWLTATEKNSKGFEIQRSIDGVNWSAIDFVNTQAFNGNSWYQLIYSFVDATPVNGRNYYRLKQLDVDGKYEYSQVRSVQLTAENGINIYPNPFETVLTLDRLSGPNTISVFNSLGQLLVNIRTSGEPSEQIDLSFLPGGVYTIAVTDNNGKTVSRKLFKRSQH